MMSKVVKISPIFKDEKQERHYSHLKILFGHFLLIAFELFLTQNRTAIKMLANE